MKSLEKMEMRFSSLPQHKQVELLLKHNKTLLCWTDQLEQDVIKAKNHYKVDTRINQIKNLTLGVIRYREFLVEKGLLNEFLEFKRKKNEKI